MDVLTVQTGDHAQGDTENEYKMPYFGFNLMDWIRSPKKYSKGLNIHEHIKCVEKFILSIKAPSSYSPAILTNSLDEDCLMELFAHPEYNEDQEDIEEIKITVRPLLSLQNLG